MPPRYRLILASQSPRRRLLLTQAGVPHEVVHPGIDDGGLEPGSVSPSEWVAALAYLKAAAGRAAAQASGAAPPCLVLGADTICHKSGELVGQPADEADARRILKLLESGSHEVLTGVALLWDHPATGKLQRHVFVDRAHVCVGLIGDSRIQEYLASEAWRGKAGAYNLLERIEAGWPMTYEGDPSTIMGLPMQMLLAKLAILETNWQ